MQKRIYLGLLLAAAVLLLAACDVPDWIIESDTGSPATAPALLPTIAATGTAIDRMYLSPATATPEVQIVENLAPETPTSAASTGLEAGQELCTDSDSGSSLSYEQALALAAGSECVAEGDLLPSHFCNQNTGTWWIGLAAEKEGCNPACVVNVKSHVAEINWRCTGLAAPGGDGEQPAGDSSASGGGSPPLYEWQGIISRQPHGSLVEYRFLSDDGQWFDIGSHKSDIRQQFASAAWNGSKVILKSEEEAVPELLLMVEEVAELDTRSAAARNLTAFAMASSSSQLASDEGGTYYAWSAVDGLLSEPWCEGVDGPGSGEWLQLDFSTPVEITEVKLANGYQSGEYLFVLNNRVQTAAIVVDDEWIAEWNLSDAAAWQSYPLAGDVTPGVTANSVRLVIEDTIDGWEFDDTCIAELEIWGRPVE